MSIVNVNKSIELLIQNEKKEILKRLKDFLENKIESDFDEISDFIDEFTQIVIEEDLNKPMKKKATKQKGTRTPSYYNVWVGNALKNLKSEQDTLSDDTKIKRTDRMKIGGTLWTEYKDSDLYIFEDYCYKTFMKKIGSNTKLWYEFKETDSFKNDLIKFKTLLKKVKVSFNKEKDTEDFKVNFKKWNLEVEELNQKTEFIKWKKNEEKWTLKRLNVWKKTDEYNIEFDEWKLNNQESSKSTDENERMQWNFYKELPSFLKSFEELNLDQEKVESSDSDQEKVESSDSDQEKVESSDSDQEKDQKIDEIDEIQKKKNVAAEKKKLRDEKKKQKDEEKKQKDEEKKQKDEESSDESSDDENVRIVTLDSDDE